MKEAIIQFLDREEETEQIRRDTLQHWKRYVTTGEIVSHEDIDSWVKTWGTDKETKRPLP